MRVMLKGYVDFVVRDGIKIVSCNVKFGVS